MSSESRKSLELLVQIGSWTGGILAAGVGGLVYAFLSKDTAPEVLPYLKWVLAPLLLALAATWYVQMHVALHARELEAADPTSTQAATGAGIGNNNPAYAPAVIPGGATAVQPKATDPDSDEEQSRKDSINASLFLQVLFQCLTLLTIGVCFFLYSGPKPDSWSFVANASDESHISYLIKVRSPETKEHEQSPSQLRLLVSDADGNWRICTVDPAAKDGSLKCPSALGPTAGRPALRLMGAPVIFHRLQYKLKYDVDHRTVDLAAEVCAAKRALLEAKAGGALVVGSHDHERVLRGASVETNESLARLRASSVAAYLSEGNACGPAVETVISLNAAPVMATRDVEKHDDVSADRSVKIYGLLAQAAVP